MAVKTNITINIVEPGSDVPVPDTGLFTHGIGGTETTIIVSAVLVTILVILSIVLTIYMYRKHKKQGKNTKLVHIVDQTKAVVKSKKGVTIGLSIIALLVSACTFTAFMLNTNKSNTSAIEGNDTEQQTGNTEQSENTNNLTINTESKELTIEVKDQPVFAVLPVQVTVEEATKAGYTLTAYTDNTDLVSTTNPNNKIPMVTVEGDELISLQDNTWGLALDNEPTSKDSKVYKALSTDQDNPTIIKTIDDYSETPANDTTTIYYGFYITPDMPYGTYTGGEVEYEAEENKVATVTFDGNGLYFNNDPDQKQNVVKYISSKQTALRYSHTPNVNDNGVQDGAYPSDSNETSVYNFPGYERIYFKIIKTEGDFPWQSNGDYFSIWSGSHPEYTALEDYGNDDSIKDLNLKYSLDGRYHFYTGYYTGSSVDIANNSVTVAYTTDSDSGCCGGTGYGYYAVIMGYTPNNNVTGEYMVPSSFMSHRFLGWSEDQNATEPTYKTQYDIGRDLDLTKGNVILYAVYDNVLSISYNNNGADSTTNMDNVAQYTTDLESTSKQVDLLAPNFKREGYGFVGWSTDPDAWNKLTDNDDTNNPTIYGPNQTITIDEGLIAKAGENRKLIMHAIWVPAEKDSQGKPVYLQNWTGCSNLDKTIYNSATSTLTVGKNTITALTDNRDNGVYTIARLADGNCWMTENLRLDNSITNEVITSEFTTENTNDPSLPLTNNYAEQTKSNRLSVSSSNWCNNGNAGCGDQSIINVDNVAKTTISPVFDQDFTSNSHNSDFDVSIVPYGIYYNWYSATAGNGRYEIGGAVTISGDICPVGWNLPIGSLAEKNGSFTYLNQRMSGNTSVIGSNDWRSFPNNFVYSGRWGGSSASAYERGQCGYYWSSTTGGPSGNTYDLELSNDRVSSGSIRDREGGLSVRCVRLAQ